MRPSRAPWWLYLIAASSLGCFALQVYSFIWGGRIGFRYDYSNGSIRGGVCTLADSKEEGSFGTNVGRIYFLIFSGSRAK